MKKKEIISLETKILPILYLNDLSGTKFVVKIEGKESSYAFILSPEYKIEDSGSEDFVAIAVTKHDYKFVEKTTPFEYGTRIIKLANLVKTLKNR